MSDKKKTQVYLISDSTGETVNSIARSAFSLFDDIEIEENNWPLIRTKLQVDSIIDKAKEISKENFTIIMFTITDREIRNYLVSKCKRSKLPYIPVLSKVVSELSFILEKNINYSNQGKQHEVGKDYFSKIEAVNFAISHDDGQSLWDIQDADIIIIGVSRTSKSPTSIYLSYKGYRTANIPYVSSSMSLIESIKDIKDVFIVALTINSEELSDIRNKRMLVLDKDNYESDYTDINKIHEETIEAKRYYVKNNWPIINVTRRSVEETSANIIQLYNEFKISIGKE